MKIDICSGEHNIVIFRNPGLGEMYVQVHRAIPV